MWLVIALLAGHVISGVFPSALTKSTMAQIFFHLRRDSWQKTSLQEVLLYYGAPTEILDMQRYLALHYQRTFYRGGIFRSCSLGGCLQGKP